MSLAYKIHKQEAAYFLTLQVVQWVDIFTRKVYRDILADSLNYCVAEKGLEIFSYVVMSNHLHMLVRASKANLSEVLRDFKRHTSRMILITVQQKPESRREWMLALFKEAANEH